MPAIPIALMLPFVPVSPVWAASARRALCGDQVFSTLFAPAAQGTLVTAGFSACAYGAAFGALQMSPPRIARHADRAEHARRFAARAEATRLNNDCSRSCPLQQPGRRAPGSPKSPAHGRRRELRSAPRAKTSTVRTIREETLCEPDSPRMTSPKDAELEALTSRSLRRAAIA